MTRRRARPPPVTSWPGICTDLCNVGVEIVADQEVVVDGQLVTSRGPAGLPAFCAAAVVEQFARAHYPIPG
ncbi:DJ-1/PfpI family protein [Streptomyces sp. NPDC050523]|uniref:DJ-1/PfpI family protein n=1 Tax=Streptomyces sp. NPDC050523 TaxID=3365622 RepID=UPI003790BFCA